MNILERWLVSMGPCGLNTVLFVERGSEWSLIIRCHGV